MATIVTRGGKGSPLTNNEVDNNFINLNTELAGKATLSSLATVATTGSYSDLVGSPTNISSFTNDAGYITSSGSITGNADTATQLATARTISLAGDVTGSATFDGSANITITAAVADDSHNHIISNVDGLQAALDGKVAKAGDTMTGTLRVGGASLGHVTLAKGNSTRSGYVEFKMADNTRVGYVGYADTQYIDIWAENSRQFRFNGAPTVMGNTIFHDGYHPNADKWTTARTLSLTGDVTGSVSWDGSGNASLSATVVDDSHNHIISNVDGLQTALDGKEPTITILPVSKGGTGTSSLTSGYVLKGNGTSPVTSSVIYDNGTNVGIGTTSPNGLLELNGGTGVVTSGGTLVVRQRGDTNADGIAVTSSNATSHRIWKDAAGALNIGPSGLSSALVQNLSGKVGIGTSSPDYTLDVAGTLAFDGSPATLIRAGGYPTADVTLLRVSANNRDLDSADYGFSIKYMGTRSGVNNSLSIFADNQVSSAIEAVTILQDGNVGIGTISPSQTLQVQGTGYATSDFRAPIFYDSDNTGRYVDPSAFSNLGSANFNGTVAVLSNSSLQIRATNNAYQRVDSRVESTNYARAHWYGVTDTGGTSNFRHAWYNGSSYINVTTDATGVDFAGTLRSTLLYDRDDTNYYVNAAGTSQLNALTLAGNLTVNNGNIYGPTYINMRYGATGAGGLFLYNSAGTPQGRWYADGAGTHGFLDNDGAWAVRVRTGTNPLEFWCDNNFEFAVATDHTVSYGSSRAPIFYDSDNTAYYVDPNSSATAINVAGKIYGVNEFYTSTAQDSWAFRATTGASSNSSGLWFSGETARILLRDSSGTIKTQLSADGSTSTNQINGNPIFHDGYHPNADTLTTARTISLTGDVSGSTSFNGSANVSITATVADDSHNHIISNVDGLQTALDGKLATPNSQEGATFRKVISQFNRWGTNVSLLGDWDEGVYGGYSTMTDGPTGMTYDPFLVMGSSTDVRSFLVVPRTASRAIAYKGSYGSGSTHTSWHYTGWTTDSTKADLSQYLSTSTGFGGDVSGTYNAIVVANDSHTHAFNNLTSKTSGTGTYQTSGDFRAPIFYDSANTAKFIDPASTSKVGSDNNYIQIGTSESGKAGVIGNTSTYDGTNLQYRTYWAYDSYYDGSNWAAVRTSLGRKWMVDMGYHVNLFRVRYYNGTVSSPWADSAWSNLFIVDPNGSVEASGDFRAPLFYDSNDTGYYVDPNSTSRLNYAVTNRIKLVNNVNNEPRWDFSAYVVEAQHWYGNNGSQTMYLGEGSNVIQIPSSNGIRPQIIYDYNDTNYYLNPNSTSYLYFLSLAADESLKLKGIRGQFAAGSDGQGISLFSNVDIGYPSGWGGGLGNTPTRGLSVYGGGRFAYSGSGFLSADTSVRGPLFYDSDNTAYYVDPASTSVLNALTVNGGAVYRSDWTTRFQSPSNFVNGTLVSTDIPATASNGDSFVIEITGKSYSASNPPFKAVAQGYLYNNTIIAFSGINYGGEFSSYIRVFEDGGVLKFWWPSISYWNSFNVNVMTMNDPTDGTITRNRVTSITNSTEPTGSKKQTINLAGFMRSDISATNSVDLRAPIFYDSNNTGYYVDPSIGSYTNGNFRFGNDYLVIRSNGIEQWATNANAEIAINYYGYAAGTTQFRDFRVYNGKTQTRLSVFGSANYTEATGSLRAPIFYDSDDTAYYVNPNSGSRFQTVDINDTIYSNNWFRSYGSTGWYNQTYGGGIFMQDSTWVRVYNNKQFYSENYIQSGSSVRAPIFYDSNNTNFYVNPDGTTSANFNGDINFGGELNMVSTTAENKYIDHHGDLRFRYSDNSSFFNERLRIAGASNFTQATGSLRAPLFYDSDDTGYYINPNATSVCSTVQSIEFQNAAGDGRGHRFWASDSYKIYMSASGNGTWGGRVAGETTSDYNMYFRMTGGTNRGFVFSAGSAGTTKVAGIDASGNGRFIGDVVAYSNSDARLKENLEVIPNALDKVQALSGYTFDWNDKQDAYEVGKRDVGVIAQDVEAVLPEVVVDRELTGYKAVNYEKLVPLLIEAIKELKAEVETLKKG